MAFISHVQAAFSLQSFAHVSAANLQTYTCFLKDNSVNQVCAKLGLWTGVVEKGSKGVVASVKKLWGLTKIICSSIASIIQDTLIEQSRLRYSNKQSQYSQYSKLHVYSYKEGDIV